MIVDSYVVITIECDDESCRETLIYDTREIKGRNLPEFVIDAGWGIRFSPIRSKYYCKKHKSEVL